MSEATDSRGNDTVFRSLQRMSKGRLVEYAFELRRELKMARADIEALQNDFVALWHLACPCGVITGEDVAEWDRLQEMGKALAAKEKL